MIIIMEQAEELYAGWPVAAYPLVTELGLTCSKVAFIRRWWSASQTEESEMLADSLQALLGRPEFVSFLLSYAASVAWDATKAGLSGLVKRTGKGGDDPEVAFAELAADSQVRRHAQHVVAEIIRLSGEEPGRFASGDVDTLAATVADFLSKHKVSEAPLSELMSQRAAELAIPAQTTDAHTICPFVAAVIVALASSQLGPAVQLATSEKTLQEAQAIRSEQKQGFAAQQEAFHHLGLKLEGLHQIVQARSSAAENLLTSVAQERMAQLSRLGQSLGLLSISDAGVTAIEIEAALAPPSLPDYFVVREAVRSGIDERIGQQPVVGITGYPSGRFA